MQADLLVRLKGSFTVQEQEAAEALEEALNALQAVKKLVSGDLFNNEEEILKNIERVLNGSDQ